MIKVYATINGVICKPANLRTDNDGKKHLGFSVKLTVPGSRNNMPGKEVYVSMSKDGDESELSGFTVGSRIEADGTLLLRKTEDNLYFNFHAATVNLAPESSQDAIGGTMEFKGTVGKAVEVKTDRNGNGYVSFSAFSTEKCGSGLQFIWIRFVRFNYTKEEFLKPKAKIHAKGKLSVSAYNGRLDFDCRLDDIRPWETLSSATGNHQP